MLSESVLAAMRSIRLVSDRYLARAHELSPRGGSVAVGGAHFDEFVRGDSLAEFLRQLPKVGPEAARDAAKAYARDCIGKWNSKREFQVRRWEGNADTVIDNAFRKVQHAQVQSSADAA